MFSAQQGGNCQNSSLSAFAAGGIPTQATQANTNEESCFTSGLDLTGIIGQQPSSQQQNASAFGGVNVGGIMSTGFDTQSQISNAFSGGVGGVTDNQQTVPSAIGLQSTQQPQKQQFGTISGGLDTVSQGFTQGLGGSGFGQVPSHQQQQQPQFQQQQQSQLQQQKSIPKTDLDKRIELIQKEISSKNISEIKTSLLGQIKIIEKVVIMTPDSVKELIECTKSVYNTYRGDPKKYTILKGFIWVSIYNIYKVMVNLAHSYPDEIKKLMNNKDFVELHIFQTSLQKSTGPL